MTLEHPVEHSDFDAAPVELATVLSVDWLKRTLPDRTEGHLADVTVLEEIRGSSTKVRLRATVADDQGTTSARQYCVKGLFDDRAGRSQTVDAEVLFYRSDLRHQLRTATPVYAGVRKDRGVLIMEDLIETRGATFAKGPSAWSPDQVAGALDGSRGCTRARGEDDQMLRPGSGSNRRRSGCSNISPPSDFKPSWTQRNRLRSE